MGGNCQLASVLLVFLMLSQVQVCILAADEVPVTRVQDASQKRAVCLDGSPAAYYYAAGSEEGTNSWIVYLMGGGWCAYAPFCQYERKLFSSDNLTTVPFVGLLSSNITVNPDFYNWNRVFVHYCDGASFLGDSENLGLDLQFRGSRIFSAVIDELLENGMKNANDAILSGGSAGGLACMLHCDEFRGYLPNAAQVKCVSDAGFFIRGKELPSPNLREGFYANVISLHNLTDFLPSSCTSRLDPSLCLFPEYFAGDIQTPLFILNSAFDNYQIPVNLKPYPEEPGWKNCTDDIFKCSPPERQLIKDFGRTFLNTLKELRCNPSRGTFIIACYSHVLLSSDGIWNSNESPRLANKTIAQAVGDWYFNRSYVQLIDTQNDFPLSCVMS